MYYEVNCCGVKIEPNELNYNTFRNAILSLFDGSINKCYLPINVPCELTVMDFDGWNGRRYFIYPIKLSSCDDKEDVIKNIYYKFLPLLKTYYQTRTVSHPFRIDIFIKRLDKWDSDDF